MTSPSPNLSFNGPSQNSSFLSPSIGGFSGDVNIVSDNNQGFYTYTKNSLNTSYVSTNYFWDQITTNSPLFTRSVYDRVLNRWFTVELDMDYILVAVSNNMDYTKGSSYQTKVPVDSGGAFYGEYIDLGLNSSYIIVTVDLVNKFSSLLSGTGIYILSKQDLLNNVTNPITVLDTDTYGLCPALSYDLDPTVYLAHVANDSLHLASITINSHVPTYNENIATYESSYKWNTVGGYAPQLGSMGGISLGDDRVQNLVIYNSNLWLTHAVFNPAVAYVMTWNININTLSLNSNLIITKSGSLISYPYIALNKNNDVAVIFSEFNSSIYPSIAYAYKDHTDPTFRTSITLASGSSSYSNSAWGHYFAASIDSADQQSFWLQGETTGSSNEWKVKIFKIEPLTYVPVPPYDFYDEGKTQLSTFTPATASWNISDHPSYQFGDIGSKILPSKVFSSADDSLVVRTSDTFKIMPTLVQTFSSLLLQKGSSNDYPLSGDIFGSGTSLLILFNAGNWSVFDIYNSLNYAYQYGTTGDVPLVGDWMNLKRQQLGMWRPSTGVFYFIDVVTGVTGGFQFGVPYPSIYNDIPLVGDFLGFGYDQLVIFRSLYGIWFFQDYLVPSRNASVQWGTSGDIPMEGRFNSNINRLDIAVFRPSNNVFYILGSGNEQYGSSGDIPIPGSSVYYRMKLLGLL